jgi:hypothetical protein
MTSYVLNRVVRHEYQLGAVIAHLGIPDHGGGHHALLSLNCFSLVGHGDLRRFQGGLNGILSGVKI